MLNSRVLWFVPALGFVPNCFRSFAHDSGALFKGSAHSRSKKGCGDFSAGAGGSFLKIFRNHDLSPSELIVYVHAYLNTSLDTI
jgi:hypothetical protein